MKKIVFIAIACILMWIFFDSFKSDNDIKLIVYTQAQQEDNKDVDVASYCSLMGVTLSVDEDALDAQVGNVYLKMKPRTLRLKFPNPDNKNYSLVIYDIHGQPIISILDISKDKVEVNRIFLKSGQEYIYKIKGNGNTYAGKFTY